MSELHPCPACKRHVRDGVCPFCGVTAIQPAPSPTLGRVARAMAFASATLAAAACGGSHKKANNNDDGQKAVDEYEQRQEQNHPCYDPDPAQVAAAQKKVDEAKTPEEKQAAETELAKVSQPMCAPYGAPPARRRVV